VEKLNLAEVYHMKVFNKSLSAGNTAANHALRMEFVLFTIFMAAFVGLLLLAVGDAERGVITVDDDGEGDYTNIQYAIDNATEGDTIRVWEGVYYENVVVNKTVSLVGNGSESTAIRGDETGNVVDITANRVNMSGFTVSGSKKEDYNAGIMVESSYNNISGMKCTDNVFGIYLDRSYYSIIANNIFILNIGHWNSGNALYLNSAWNNIIANNTCSGSLQSITLNGYLQNNTFRDNRMTDSGFYFISDSLVNWNTHHIDSTNTVNGKPVYYFRNVTGVTVPSDAGQVIIANCSGIVIENLNCSYTTTGIAVVYSSDIAIAKNTCLFNEDHGIILRASYDCVINNNDCSNGSRYGMYLYEVNGTISNNTCLNNPVGISLVASAGCTIFNNLCQGDWGTGIEILLSDNNIISGNTCSGKSGEGMETRRSRNNLFIDNICSNNSYGMKFSESENNSIVNNTCSDNGYHGISLSRWSDYNEIDRNTCLNNSNGIEISGSDYNTIKNGDCSFNRNGIDIYKSHYNIVFNMSCHSSDSDGIHISRSDHNTISTSNCSDNDAGIYVYRSNYNYIVNNACWSNYYNGIEVRRESTHNYLLNNTCSNNSNGIEIVWDCAFNTLDNNTCQFNKECGIHVDMTISTTLTNNNCSYNSNGSREASGIYCRALSSGILANNSCHGNLGYGIYILSASNSTVAGNNCSGNGFGFDVLGNEINGSGIYLYGVENSSVSYNNCSANVHGIDLGVSFSNMITGNSLTRNSNSGIYLEFDSHNNSFSGNTISRNTFGIYLTYHSLDNSAQNNNIIDNVEYGICVFLNDNLSINASENWWGSASGPYHPTKNPDGTGDNITDHVLFEPWGMKDEKGLSISTADIDQCLEDEEHKIRYEATDPENGTLTWYLSTDADFLSINASTGLLYGIPAQQDVGFHFVNISVSDGELSDHHNFTLEVINVNDIPRITITAPGSGATVGGELVIAGTATDEDGTRGLVVVQIKVDEGQWLSAQGIENWSFLLDTTALENGSHTIYARVDDGLEFSPISSVEVTVNNVDPEDLLLPDFAVMDDIDISSPGEVGAKTTISVSIRNRGKQAGAVDVRFYMNRTTEDNLLFNVTFEVEEGQITVVDVEWIPTREGPVTIVVVLVNRSGMTEEDSGNNRASANFTILPERQKKDDSDDEGILDVVIIHAPSAIGAGFVVSLFAVICTEGNRFRLFLLSFPLFTRLTKDDIEKDIEQQNIRGRIYQYIVDNPGTNFTCILRDIDAGNGTTAYHLDILEKNNFIMSARKGHRKYFFKASITFPYRLQANLSFTELEILNALRAGGNLSVSQIAEIIDKSVQTASYNIINLERKKFIESSKHWQSKICSMTGKGEKYLDRHRL